MAPGDHRSLAASACLHAFRRMAEKPTWVPELAIVTALDELGGELGCCLRRYFLQLHRRQPSLPDAQNDAAHQHQPANHEPCLKPTCLPPTCMITSNAAS